MSDWQNLLVWGKAGPRPIQDGGLDALRLSKDAALVNVPGHAQYQEAVMRGNVFISCNQTGVTTQAGLAVTTPTLTLYNPVNSGKAGVLLYAGFVMSVSTAAACVVWLAANVNASASAVTGTAATLSSCRIADPAQPTLKCYTAATLPAAPVAISILGVGCQAALTTALQLYAFQRYYDGSIIVWPGGALSFQTSTASGAAGAWGEFVWEEVSI
jgi:hypothetical protein